MPFFLHNIWKEKKHLFYVCPLQPFTPLNMLADFTWAEKLLHPKPQILSHFLFLRSEPALCQVSTIDFCFPFFFWLWFSWFWVFVLIFGSENVVLFFFFFMSFCLFVWEWVFFFYCRDWFSFLGFFFLFYLIFELGAWWALGLGFRAWKLLVGMACGCCMWKICAFWSSVMIFDKCFVDVLVSFEQGRLGNGLMGLIHLLGFWGLWIGGWGGIFAHSRVSAVVSVYVEGF